MKVTTAACPVDDRYVLYLRDGLPADCSGCKSAADFRGGHVHAVPIEYLLEPIDWTAFCRTLLGIEDERVAA